MRNKAFNQTPLYLALLIFHSKKIKVAEILSTVKECVSYHFTFCITHRAIYIYIYVKILLLNITPLFI